MNGRMVDVCVVRRDGRHYWERWLTRFAVRPGPLVLCEPCFRAVCRGKTIEVDWWDGWGGVDGWHCPHAPFRPQEWVWLLLTRRWRTRPRPLFPAQLYWAVAEGIKVGY